MEPEEWQNYNCFNCGFSWMYNPDDAPVCPKCGHPIGQPAASLSKEEVLAILRNPEQGKERDHQRADAALLRFINDQEIAEAFFRLEKWYS